MESEKNIRFFVIGAAKAGTTTLYAFLKQHPEVFLPNVKEPHYYANVQSERKSDYDKVDRNKTYHTRIIQSEGDYKALYSGSEAFKAVGDCSPSYLWDEEAAEKIHRDFPKARIVVILRNPIERAYSHYLMDIREGLQSERNFFTALKNDAAEFPKVWGGKSHLYTELGMYHEQLKRYSCFGQNQIKVFVYEEFFSNLEVSYNELCDFLEISPPTMIRGNDQGKSNVFASPKNKLAAKLIQWNQKTQFFGRLFPENLRRRLKQTLMSKSAEKPPMEEAAREYLTQFYKEEVHLLEKEFNLNLSVWKESFLE